MPINWYVNPKGVSIGIWNNNGNKFEEVLNKICYREKVFEHIIENIVIVTDYDDESAKNERSQSLYHVLAKELGNPITDCSTLINNEWVKFKLTNSFEVAVVSVCFLLVPIDKVGALETYMLDALTEKSDEQESIIEQSKKFVVNINSNTYLKHRREVTKATLGVALSIFNPERIFRIMNEILGGVDWGNFATSNRQFGIFKDFLED